MCGLPTSQEIIPWITAKKKVVAATASPFRIKCIFTHIGTEAATISMSSRLRKRSGKILNTNSQYIFSASFFVGPMSIVRAKVFVIRILCEIKAHPTKGQFYLSIEIGD